MLLCLAMNIYMEARGEPIESQIAVAAITLNRVEDKDYPKSICEVVYQSNQFSWVKQRLKVKNIKAFNKCKQIAYLYLNRKLKNPIGKRVYFNHKRLGKRFKTKYKPITIKNLTFY